jgi:hypothetical protein
MPLTQLEPYMSNSSANFTFTGASLGPVANVKIAGGSSGQVLSTDGTGNLAFTSSATTGKAFALSLVFGG